MECRDAQFYLRLRRHTADELGPEIAAALEGHFAFCPACAADARATESFDRAVAAAMRAVPLPAGLRERLVAHVASKQGAILRQRFYRSALAVAAAGVLLLLGLGIFSTTRPTVDTESLVRNGEQDVMNPEEATRAWLRAQRLPDRLPLDFDYALHMHHGIEKLQGKDVPYVLFRSSDVNDPRGFAKVYIFREGGRFDVKHIAEAQGSHTTARIMEFAGTKYVILHTGPRLDPFLSSRRGSGNVL